MSGIRNYLLGALVSLATVLPAPVSAAPPVPPRPQVSGDVENARVVCDDYGCYDTRRPYPPDRRPGWHPPPPRPGWDPPRPGWRPPPPPPPPYYPPPVYRPLPPPPLPVYRPPPVYAPPVYGVPPAVWRRHVNWCLNRYRSYNPETNRFLSTSGYYKVCRSPYL
ncbi:BA14K family protein [Ciceribacter sp. L1K22]|uniref:BA14K family protein n=1 Tax=Ciceribacter sp. L1K22 TaxID=2820275 RepID=UPI001ABE51B5|nr:BA14K family protein [Ciceribacter sp. L1K22]MBO3758626.1 BA14K family protein [Ciceribacter sp. L1K22]